MGFFTGRKDTGFTGVPTNNREAERFYGASIEALQAGRMADAISSVVSSLTWAVPTFFDEHPFDGEDCKPSDNSFGAFFNSLDVLGRCLRAANELDRAERVFAAGIEVAQRKDRSGSWKSGLRSRLEAVRARKQYAPGGGVTLTGAGGGGAFDSSGFVMAKDLGVRVDGVLESIRGFLAKATRKPDADERKDAERTGADRERNAARLFAKAEELIGEEKYKEAMDWIDRALELDQHSAAMNYARGYCMLRQAAEGGKSTMSLGQAMEIAQYLRVAAKAGHEQAQKLLDKLGSRA